jgi:hypothetical protein
VLPKTSGAVSTFETAFASVMPPSSVTGQTGLLGLDNLFGIADSNGASGEFRFCRCGAVCDNSPATGMRRSSLETGFCISKGSSIRSERMALRRRRFEISCDAGKVNAPARSPRRGLCGLRKSKNPGSTSNQSERRVFLRFNQTEAAQAAASRFW